jgi:5'-nucleotidase / UDP-sugar diphosphatase
MIESIRKNEPSVLLVDCGAVFNSEKDTAELMLNSMELMGYDALNLGGPEFYFGKEFLERARSRVSFPYIASNLLSGGSRIPWIQEYVIKEVGGIRIAILGVLNPAGLAQLPNQEQLLDLQVVPPETALTRVLPEVREKADLVILLSRFNVKETIALVKTIKGIDVAISSGSDDVFYAEPLENTVILQTGSLGKTLGLLKITIDEKRRLSVSDRRHVPLFSSVPDNERIKGLVEKFKKDMVTKEADRVKKRHEELIEGLQLTPQEFMDRYRKDIEKEKGAAR